MDLVIAGGTVVDGSGAPGYRADVGVQDGRIVAIEDLAASAAAERLDATGKVVAPGFIDPHTHSDLALLLNPEAHSKVRQGVTTEVIGNCGSSPAPLTGPYAGEVRARASGAQGQVEWNWRTFGDYLQKLAAARPAVNVVPLVGHVTLRTSAMGMQNRPPSTEEMAQMENIPTET